MMCILLYSFNIGGLHTTGCTYVQLPYSDVRNYGDVNKNILFLLLTSYRSRLFFKTGFDEYAEVKLIFGMEKEAHLH